MTRVFRRGELKEALLHALAANGPASGYVIMHALADRIGGGWRPSPGAIYPALLALEDTGLIAATDADGNRIYRLTAAGEREQRAVPDLLDTVAARAATTAAEPSVGEVLDRFAGRFSQRRERLDAAAARAVTTILDDAARRIETVLEQRST